ncbi:MAG: HEPN domain-containing protein [Chloroflexi bacterium]|nr:HEPN domain-containing protein [Chloroflexota bacterium]
MASRSEDWLRQAKSDLELARDLAESAHFEWACFAAQQAAEKAVKALYQKLGADAWGHVVALLLMSLPKEFNVGRELVDRAKELDKHYIMTRYPNSHASGAPVDLYTEAEAKRALENADAIVAFCEDHLLR